MRIDIYSEYLIGDYNPIERLAHTCRHNYEYGRETDASTQTCVDNISCDYVVGTVNYECNVRYQNKVICGNTMNYCSDVDDAYCINRDGRFEGDCKPNSMVLEDHVHSKCIHDEIDDRYTRNVQGFHPDSNDGYDCYNIDEYAIYQNH